MVTSLLLGEESGYCQMTWLAHHCGFHRAHHQWMGLWRPLSAVDRRWTLLAVPQRMEIGIVLGDYWERSGEQLSAGVREDLSH